MGIKKTTGQFKVQAILKHGDKFYDYSLVEYKGTHKKVKIICPTHGEFEQIAKAHSINGRGCEKCGYIMTANKRTRSYTLGYFKSLSIIKHGDRFYDYSKSEYINAKSKLIIICPTHGEFEQSPEKHLNGQQCPSCVGIVPYTMTEFMNKAKDAHSNKYTYENVVLGNREDKVEIICKKHGSFFQTAKNHFLGKGCPYCAGRHKTSESLISDFKLNHGDRYDYSKVNYVNAKTKVKIICKEHGEFEQLPNGHLDGKNCPECSGNVKSNKDDFIVKAINIHGEGSYDYSFVEYKRAILPVKIICNKHGEEFEQSPNAHLAGKGCSICAGQSQQEGYINAVLDGETLVAVKFGIANKYKVRVNQQNSKSLFTVKNLWSFKFPTVEDCKVAEKHCKAELERGILTKREMPDGYTETTHSYNIDRIIAIFIYHGGRIINK